MIPGGLILLLGAYCAAIFSAAHGDAIAASSELFLRVGGFVLHRDGPRFSTVLDPMKLLVLQASGDFVGGWNVRLKLNGNVKAKSNRQRSVDAAYSQMISRLTELERVALDSYRERT